MSLHVVLCRVEGCEECGNSCSVVGVFSDETKATEAKNLHESRKHLHGPFVDIIDVEMNVEYYNDTYDKKE